MRFNWIDKDSLIKAASATHDTQSKLSPNWLAAKVNKEIEYKERKQKVQ